MSNTPAFHQNHVDVNVKRINRRSLHSVSEICVKDEIDDLLEDILKLQANYYMEGTSEFNIAGSQNIGGEQNDVPQHSMGSLPSWDSHAVYRVDVESCEYDPGIQKVQLVCDIGSVKNTHGYLKLLLLFFSVVSLSYCCSLDVEGGDVFNLPFGSTFRWFAAVCVYSVIIVVLYLISDLLRITAYLHIDWNSVNCLLFTSLGGLFVLMSTLIIVFTVQRTEDYYWLSEESKHQFLVTAILGLMSALTSFVIAVSNCSCQMRKRTRPIPGPDPMPIADGLVPNSIQEAPIELLSPTDFPTVVQNRNPYRPTTQPIVRHSVSWSDGQPAYYGRAMPMQR